MSGAGYIQLSAIGEQDAYLTGSPSITYFSGVYKRHTPFVLEAFDVPFLGQNVLYGTTNICRIPPKGDLIRAVAAKITLPALADPGSNWQWTIIPSVSAYPHLLINGVSNAVTTVGISYYTTTNLNKWLLPPISSYVSYNSTLNTFIFSNCQTIEVDGTTGVFFGLDPFFGTTSTAFIGDSNLIYTVGSSSNLSSNSFSNTSPNYISNVTYSAQFTLEQAGWIRATVILPYSPLESALFVNLSSSYPTMAFNQPGPYPGGFQYINLKSPQFTNQDFTTFYSITPNGRISFSSVGFYLLRIVLSTDFGDILNLAYGSDQYESIPSQAIPSNPNYVYNYPLRVSTDPTMPIILPINVTNTANTYYFFANTTSTTTHFVSPSYFSIQTVQNIFLLKSTTLSGSINSNVNFYSNITAYSNTTTGLILNTDSSFTFQFNLIYLLVGSIYLDTGYVSNVSIVNRTTSSVVYTYDLSKQGRDPTFVFSLPLPVYNTSTVYYVTISTTGGATTILSNSYFAFQQIGSISDYSGFLYYSNYNGLLLNTTTTTYTSNTQLNFQTNFTTTGASNLISINASTGNFQFANVGTYVLSAVISTASQLTTLTFGNTTYQIGLSGLGQQWNVNIPYHATQINIDVPVSFTTSDTTASLYSNTYFAIYPYSSNVNFTFPSNYYDSVGTYMIDNAQLKIGGQTIETLTGEYIELWNDLNVPYENQNGLKLLTGKNDSSNAYSPRTYIVNLPFYFYENPGLYLPIVSLPRQDVEVWITFKNLQSLTTSNTSNIIDPLLTTLIVEYVYLADPEIAWFKGAEIDYKITQTQYQNFQLPIGFTSAILDLQFINPIKELFFIIQLDGSTPYQYSNLINLSLKFNDAESFTNDVTDAVYLNSLEPFNHYINYPSRLFYMYSFSRDPRKAEPTGQINLSRIRYKFLELTTQSFTTSKQFRVIGVNYNILRIKNGLCGLAFNSNDL